MDRPDDVYINISEGVRKELDRQFFYSFSDHVIEEIAEIAVFEIMKYTYSHIISDAIAEWLSYPENDEIAIRYQKEIW